MSKNSEILNVICYCYNVRFIRTLYLCEYRINLLKLTADIESLNYVEVVSSRYGNNERNSIL